MAVYIFKSTDAGAPTLSGTAGDLTNLFDKLLVDGYNSQTITITRTGAVATANCTAHGFVSGQRVVVSGANETDYNIETRITVTDANNFTYTVANNPTSPATGTISAKVAPLGWTQAYTGTNKRAWQQKAGTNQFYLRMTDDGTGSAVYARIIGYEAMTDVDTGTNPFPTNAQVAGGLYHYKSSAASATTRAWWCFSDGNFFYFLSSYNGTTAWETFCFGDFRNYDQTDIYGTIIGGQTSAQSNHSQTTANCLTNGSSLPGLYIARLNGGAGGSIAAAFTTPSVNGANVIGAANQYGNNYTYPSPNCGGLLMSRVIVFDGDSSVSWLRGPRGRLPGIWHILNIHSFATGDTFSGAAGSLLDGRQFELRICGASSSGWLVFETSDTWD